MTRSSDLSVVLDRDSSGKTYPWIAISNLAPEEWRKLTLAFPDPSHWIGPDCFGRWCIMASNGWNASSLKEHVEKIVMGEGL